MKCVDQVSKYIWGQLLVLAGFPLPLLRAYGAVHNAVWYRNTLATGLGRIHKRKFGISQGCPWCMLFVALWTAPWVSLMKGVGARPRTLADDILLMCQGPNHEQTLIRAANMTLMFYRCHWCQNTNAQTQAVEHRSHK